MTLYHFPSDSGHCYRGNNGGMPGNLLVYLVCCRREQTLSCCYASRVQDSYDFESLPCRSRAPLRYCFTIAFTLTAGACFKSCERAVLTWGISPSHDQQRQTTVRTRTITAIGDRHSENKELVHQLIWPTIAAPIPEIFRAIESDGLRLT